MDDRTFAHQFSGKAERRGRDLSLFRVLRREAEKVGGGDARREHRFAGCCEILDGGGIGSTQSPLHPNARATLAGAHRHSLQ